MNTSPKAKHFGAWLLRPVNRLKTISELWTFASLRKFLVGPSGQVSDNKGRRVTSTKIGWYGCVLTEDQPLYLALSVLKRPNSLFKSDR